MKKHRINLENKRWFIVGAVFLMQLCIGTVHAWSIFKKPLMLDHGWSETSTQSTYVILMFAMGLASAFAGKLIDKKGFKIIAIVGSIFFGVGNLISGWAIYLENLWALYLGYGMLAGIGAGLNYVTSISILIKWFPDKRGLVSGLAVMGFGAGSFFMGLIAPKMIINLGVSTTFYIWGAIFLTLTITTSLFYASIPDGWLSVNKTNKPMVKISSIKSFSFEQAIRRYQWWVLWVILFLNITIGLGLISQLSPLAQEVLKNNNPTASSTFLAIRGGTIMAIAMIFNGLGRLLWASISDILGRKNTFIILFISQAVFYVCLPYVSNVVLFTIIACYLLSCFGGATALMPAFAADTFGPKDIEKIYGMMLTSLAIAGTIGPLIFAQMQEISLFIAAGLSVIAFFLIMPFKKPTNSERLS